LTSDISSPTLTLLLAAIILSLLVLGSTATKYYTAYASAPTDLALFIDIATSSIEENETYDRDIQRVARLDDKLRLNALLREIQKGGDDLREDLQRLVVSSDGDDSQVLKLNARLRWKEIKGGLEERIRRLDLLRMRFLVTYMGIVSAGAQGPVQGQAASAARSQAAEKEQHVVVERTVARTHTRQSLSASLSESIVSKVKEKQDAADTQPKAIPKAPPPPLRNLRTQAMGHNSQSTGGGGWMSVVRELQLSPLLKDRHASIEEALLKSREETAEQRRNITGVVKCGLPKEDWTLRRSETLPSSLGNGRSGRRERASLGGVVDRPARERRPSLLVVERPRSSDGTDRPATAVAKSKESESIDSILTRAQTLSVTQPEKPKSQPQPRPRIPDTIGVKSLKALSPTSAKTNASRHPEVVHSSLLAKKEPTHSDTLATSKSSSSPAAAPPLPKQTTTAPTASASTPLPRLTTPALIQRPKGPNKLHRARSPVKASQAWSSMGQVLSKKESMASLHTVDSADSTLPVGTGDKVGNLEGDNEVESDAVKARRAKRSSIERLTPPLTPRVNPETGLEVVSEAEAKSAQEAPGEVVGRLTDSPEKPRSSQLMDFKI
jgi:hypothetical protein